MPESSTFDGHHANSPRRTPVLNWLKVNWNDLEWPLIIAAGLTSLILGTIGFVRYYAQFNEPISSFDALYRSWQLFTLESGAFEPGVTIPWMLQVARWSAPIVAAYTLIQALKEVFKDQFMLLRLRLTRNHAVVCGLGRKGFLLTRELRQQGFPVVVIDQESSNQYLAACRELGAIPLTGDGRDPMMLLKAGLTRARFLLAVCGEDGTNAEIAEQARSLRNGRPEPAFTCLAHITDTYLWTLLREREFYNAWNSDVRLELFNIYDSGARILLRETFEICPDSPPHHMLIIGMGELAENLIVHAAQVWCLQGMPTRLPVSVIDPHAGRVLEALTFRYPLVRYVCDLHPYTIPIDRTELQKVTHPDGNTVSNDLTHAYVCLDDSALGLQAGFTLLQLLQDKGTQIMVRMSEDSGLANFLRESGGSYANLSAFGLLERTCKMELLDDGTNLALARAIHAHYVEEEARLGHTPATNPSMVSWDELPAELRRSNQRQAKHIGAKLKTVGCAILPWREYGAENFVFTDEEVERMAIMEHESWWQERLSSGWKYGPERNNAAKIHPDMLPWDDPRFTEEAKEKDRRAVRLIPHLLARAGFQIYRLPPETNGAPPASRSVPAAAKAARRR